MNVLTQKTVRFMVAYIHAYIISRIRHRSTTSKIASIEYLNNLYMVENLNVSCL